MEIVQAVMTRRSIRAFHDSPVSLELLRTVLQTALRAPSSGNSQPWELYVVSGKILKKISDDNVGQFSAGYKAQFEVPRSEPIGTYRDRHVALGTELYRLMNIDRENRVERTKWIHWGLRYFGAPVAIFVTVDRSITPSFAGFDVGLLAQNICLVALNYGLGTCIELQGVAYPEVIRKYAAIPGSKAIYISIAIGYPDLDHPANMITTPREPLEKVATWCGFIHDS
jgi:nitroreductase